MVKKIVKGKHIFARKAQPATEADRQVVTDLIDTLRANTVSYTHLDVYKRQQPACI